MRSHSWNLRLSLRNLFWNLEISARLITQLDDWFYPGTRYASGVQCPYICCDFVYLCVGPLHNFFKSFSSSFLSSSWALAVKLHFQLERGLAKFRVSLGAQQGFYREAGAVEGQRLAEVEEVPAGAQVDGAGQGRLGTKDQALAGKPVLILFLLLLWLGLEICTMMSWIFSGHLFYRFASLPV